MSGRPPKPSKIKELQGTSRGDRQLANEMQLRPVTLPQPPGWLDKDAKEVWVTVTVELEALQLLSTVDFGLLGAYCQEIALYRKAIKKMRGREVILSNNGIEMPNPWVGIAHKALDAANKLSSKFGFTPADRSRIGVSKPPEKDPFDNFLDA